MAKHRTPARRAQKGETLAEVLVALLVVALATLLLASMITVSSSVNISARHRDEALYTALRTVEDKAADPTAVPQEGHVAIYDKNSTTKVGSYEVNVYTEGAITLYKQP